MVGIIGTAVRKNSYEFNHDHHVINHGTNGTVSHMDNPAFLKDESLTDVRDSGVERNNYKMKTATSPMVIGGHSKTIGTELCEIPGQKSSNNTHSITEGSRETNNNNYPTNGTPPQFNSSSNRSMPQNGGPRLATDPAPRVMNVQSPPIPNHASLTTVQSYKPSSDRNYSRSGEGIVNTVSGNGLQSNGGVVSGLHQNNNVPQLNSTDLRSRAPVNVKGMMLDDNYDMANKDNNYSNNNDSKSNKLKHNGADQSSYTNNNNNNTPSADFQGMGVRGYSGVTIRNSRFMVKWAKPLLAECLGTLILVFVGTLQSASGQGIAGAAWTHGLILAILICVFGNISGAHFNPVVTLALVFNGAIQVKKALFYMVSQLIGSLLGALLYYFSTNAENYLETMGGMVSFNSQKHAIGNVIVCETLLTAIFLFVVLAMALQEDCVEKDGIIACYNCYPYPEVPCYVVPFVIGLTLVVSIIAGGSVSGAGLNPFRVLGPAVVYVLVKGSSVYSVFNNQYVYYVGEVLGCLIAVVLYKVLIKQPKIKNGLSF